MWSKKKKKGIGGVLTLVIVNAIWQYSPVSRFCCTVEMKSLLNGQMFLSSTRSKPVRKMNANKQPSIKLQY